MDWRNGLIRAARTTGIVLWHVQHAHQTLTAAPRTEAPRTRDDVVPVPVVDESAPEPEPDTRNDAEFLLLNEQLAQLTSRLDALHPREGDSPAR